MRWDWDHAWGGLLYSAIIAALLFAIVAICKPHNVDYYYLSASSEGQKCVWAHWTWHSDEKAFCSTDADETLNFAAKASAILANKRPQ